VKRAAADQILALTLELDAGQLNQALQRHLLLQPLNLGLWDPRHDRFTKSS
jgi:hypothetical protein